MTTRPLPPMPARLAGEAELRRQRQEGTKRQHEAKPARYYIPRYPCAATKNKPELDVIFRAMNVKRVTYDEVAEGSEVSDQTLRQWRRGRSSPRLDHLLRVYRSLDIRWRVYIPGVDN